MNVLELGQYIVPAYAGMVLAEQGHHVVKWCGTDPDPVEGLHRGAELWDWINHGKTVTRGHHARDVVHPLSLHPGPFDVVLDNFRASAWERWGVDPAEVADREGVTWVSMRDDFDGRSFDAIAQARAWGDHLGDLPVYLGDTAGGLWMAFKAMQRQPGHHVLRQAACLGKLVEGELVVKEPRSLLAGQTPWDEPGTYGINPEGTGTRVVFKGDVVEEPYRDDAWREERLRHRGGRYVI